MSGMEVISSALFEDALVKEVWSCPNVIVSPDVLQEQGQVLGTCLTSISCSGQATHTQEPLLKSDNNDDKSAPSGTHAV